MTETDVLRIQKAMIGIGDAATTTTSDDRTDSERLLFTDEPRSCSRRPHFFVIEGSSAKVVPSSSEETGWVKYFWSSQHSPPSQQKTALWYFTASEDEIGHPENVVSSVSHWPVLWGGHQETKRSWRGVFSLHCPRTQLFSAGIDLRISEIPRWRPHITISRRSLNTDE